MVRIPTNPLAMGQGPGGGREAGLSSSLMSCKSQVSFDLCMTRDRDQSHLGPTIAGFSRWPRSKEATSRLPRRRAAGSAGLRSPTTPGGVGSSG